MDLSLPPRLGNRDDVISDVLVDPTCPSRIYAARGHQPEEARRHGGGVSVSEDAGDHWVSMTEGDAIDNVPITDLDMDPRYPRRLYVATFGLGVWQLDWAIGRLGAIAALRRRPAMIRLYAVVVLATLMLIGCDECPEGQSTCEDSRGERQCYFDDGCGGPAPFACPPTVCEEGAATECVDLLTNELHCGECDIQCPAGVSCERGQCGGTRE